MGHFQYECPSDTRTVNFAEYKDNEELVLMTSVDVKEYKEETQMLMATLEDKDVKEDKAIWFLDSARSNHMTGSKKWFINLDETYNHKVRLGNDTRLEVKGKGDIRIITQGRAHVVTSVYYVPMLTSNLLSVGQMQDKSLTCPTRWGVQGVSPRQRFLQVVDDSKTQLWHRRYGHVNHKAIRTMLYKKMVTGLPTLADKHSVCAIGKQHKDNFPKKSNWHAKERLELIHTDLCGHVTPATMSGKRQGKKLGWQRVKQTRRKLPTLLWAKAIC